MRVRKLATLISLALSGAVVAGLGGCGGTDNNCDLCKTGSLQTKVGTIVFIYAENHSFDNLYGLYPGANGIPGLNPTASGTISPQVDRTSGAALATLPQTWGGVTAAGQAPVVTQAMSASLSNAPFNIQTTYNLPQTIVTRDLYHRFFENQMQINGGKNDKMASWADSKSARYLASASCSRCSTILRSRTSRTNPCHRPPGSIFVLTSTGMNVPSLRRARHSAT